MLVITNTRHTSISIIVYAKHPKEYKVICNGE